MVVSSGDRNSLRKEIPDFVLSIGGNRFYGSKRVYYVSNMSRMFYSNHEISCSLPRDPTLSKNPRISVQEDTLQAGFFSSTIELGPQHFRFHHLAISCAQSSQGLNVYRTSCVIG